MTQKWQVGRSSSALGQVITPKRGTAKAILRREYPSQSLLLTREFSLYSFMIGEFHQARTFALELMVVIILSIELIFLFRGKS